MRKFGCDEITIASVEIESHSFAQNANEWGTRLTDNLGSPTNNSACFQMTAYKSTNLLAFPFSTLKQAMGNHLETHGYLRAISFPSIWQGFKDIHSRSVRMSGRRFQAAGPPNFCARLYAIRGKTGISSKSERMGCSSVRHYASPPEADFRSDVCLTQGNSAQRGHPKSVEHIVEQTWNRTQENNKRNRNVCNM